MDQLLCARLFSSSSSTLLLSENMGWGGVGQVSGTPGSAGELHYIMGGYSSYSTSQFWLIVDVSRGNFSHVFYRLSKRVALSRSIWGSRIYRYSVLPGKHQSPVCRLRIREQREQSVHIAGNMSVYFFCVYFFKLAVNFPPRWLCTSVSSYKTRQWSKSYSRNRQEMGGMSAIKERCLHVSHLDEHLVAVTEGQHGVLIILIRLLKTDSISRRRFWVTLNRKNICYRGCSWHHIHECKSQQKLVEQKTERCICLRHSHIDKINDFTSR